MKHPLLVLISTILALSSLAGTPQKLITSNQYQLPAGYKDIGIAGNYQTGFVQFSSKNNSLSIQRFSPQLKLSSQKTIEFVEMPKANELLDHFEWHGKYYCLFTDFTYKSGVTRLFIAEIEIENEKIISKTTTKEISISPESQVYSLDLNFTPDSAKICLSARLFFDKKSAEYSQRVFGLWVLNEKFELEWSGKANMGEVKPKFYLSELNTTVDKQGNFLFVTKLEDEKAKSDDTRYKYELLKFSKGNSQPVKIPLPIDKKYIVEIKAFSALNDDIIYAVAYSAGAAHKERPEGWLLLRPEGNLLLKDKQGWYPISADVYKQYQPEYDPDGRKPESVLLRDIIFNKDGSKILIGEEYAMSMDGDRTYYTHGSLIVQYIDAKGDVAYAKKLAKHQFGSNNRLGLGFRIVRKNGDLYAVFLDNSKNAGITADIFPVMHKAGYNGMLVAVKIDTSGEFKKTTLLDTNVAELTFEFSEKDKITNTGAFIMRVTPGANKPLAQRFSDKNPGKLCLVEMP